MNPVQMIITWDRGSGQVSLSTSEPVDRIAMYGLLKLAEEMVAAMNAPQAQQAPKLLIPQLRIQENGKN